jgi:uncharacterized membrane protein HdeD (DUF308 family)
MATQVLSVDAEKIAAHRGWFFALGIALVVLGTAAILFPFYGSLAGARIFGWIMLFSGIATAVHAIRASGWGLALLQGVIAIAYALAGVWILSNPLAGVATLTLVLIVVLLVQGIIAVIEAFQIRPAEGWGWMLVSGIASIVLAIMLKMEFPSSALWAIGLLVGVSLAIHGWSFIAMAVGSRKKSIA